jgi:hypothetical protein
MLAIIQQMVGPLPSWVPNPEIKGAENLIDKCCVLLFLSPLVAISAYLTWTVIIFWDGKMTIKIEPERVLVFTGGGIFSWTQYFDPGRLTCISMSRIQRERLIDIQAGKTIRFGAMLTEDRTVWIYVMLRKIYEEKLVNSRRVFVNDARLL